MSSNRTQGRVPHRILRPLDINQIPPRDSAMGKPAPAITQQHTVDQSPIKDQSGDKRPKEIFEEVHKLRIAEGLTDVLADMGVKEWSIDDFEFLRKLGSGASATVYQAKEKISGYQVALKVQEYDENEVSAVADVELDIHCDLDHPNVVNMIDYFFDDVPFGDESIDYDDEEKRYFYMILELCDKGSLFDVIDKKEEGWLEECDAVGYFRGCLNAVKYLHDNNLIHCDVKTANFLVDKNYNVKLADFGMTIRSNELEVLGGSPIFMAPEHLQAWRNEGKDFDYRVDIYGLGVTLFQMLVGDLPFYLIENDEDNKAADSLQALFGKLTLGDEPSGFNPARLDVRKLNEFSSKELFVLPPISFPDSMSNGARDLISRLMEPNRENRISISEALEHVWFQSHM